jgi:choline dehydrogenase
MQTLGYPYNPDFNGERQRGVGFMQHTIDPMTRRRCSAVEAFLKPVLGNSRLTLLTRTRVTGLLIENGRAVGVRYIDNGTEQKAHAAAEVILTAGAFVTPKLLMLSGIGPAQHLKDNGLRVEIDLPGVGQNLQDHHEVPLIGVTKGAFGYFGQDRGLAMLRNGFQYLCFRSGPVTTTGVEACAFVDPDGNADSVSIQLYCVPTVYLDRDVTGVEPTHGVTFTSCVLRPKSRGSVTLQSADPRDPPLVDCKFLHDADDLRLQVSALRFSREVLNTPPLRDMVEREILPGADVHTGSQLETYCRRTVKTNYHPVGTCRMGPDSDPMSVLDERLRVRGVEGLRVFDVSMMPAIISGNTNAPALAIAHRAVSLMMQG